jgi:heme oxygenase (biliverdin-IX-beta and delta-forming)
MSASAALLLLNQETRSHHADADRPWLALLSEDVRAQDYMRQLMMTYGFQAPLEAALAYTSGLWEIVKLRERARAGFLAQDLLALGLSPAQLTTLPHCFTITPFRDAAEALGWMYVSERATLLHEQIRRHLLKFAPIVAYSSSYLAAYEGFADLRWSSFGEALDSFVENGRHWRRLCAATDHAFRRWCSWINSST